MRITFLFHWYFGMMIIPEKSVANYNRFVSNVCLNEAGEISYLNELCQLLENTPFPEKNVILEKIINVAEERLLSRKMKRNAASISTKKEIEFLFLRDILKLINKMTTYLILPNEPKDLKWLFRLLRVNEASRFSLMKLYDFNAMGFEKLVNQSCLVVIPYQLERIEELILSVPENILNRVNWLINDPSESRFSQSNLAFTSRFYTFYVKEDHVVVNEIYKKNINFDNQIKVWNLWSITDGLAIRRKNLLDRRSDLTGIVIRAATLEVPPFVYAEKIPNTELLTIRGYLADVWNTLQETLNFTTMIRESSDGNWGSPNPDGTWTGMLGMIQRDEIDITISEMVLASVRTKEFDYSNPILTAPVKMYIPNQDFQNEEDWLMFLRPMQIEIWISVLIGLIIFVVALKCMQFWCKDEEIFFSKLIEAVFYIAIQRGSLISPNQSSHRVILMTLELMCLIIFGAFTAGLYSSLAVVKNQLPFKDLTDLYENSNFKVGTVKGSIYEYNFKNEVPIHKKSYEEKWLHMESIEKALEFMKSKPKYAFIWDKFAIDTFNYDTCELKELTGFERRDNYVFYMKKDFEYKKLFGYHIKKIRENGQTYKYWNFWKPLDTNDQCGKIESAKSVGFEKLTSAFVMLLTFSILSLILIILEVIWKKLSND